MKLLTACANASQPVLQSGLANEASRPLPAHLLLFELSQSGDATISSARCGFRVLAGLSGLWIPIFGPSLVYVLAYRNADLPGFVIVLLAALALVVLLGRLVATVMLQLEELAKSWLMTATLVAMVAIALFTLEPLPATRSRRCGRRPATTHRRLRSSNRRAQQRCPCSSPDRYRSARSVIVIGCSSFFST